MADTNREYFEVNFKENQNIRPETVKASDIADVLKAVESMVESQVYQTLPEVKKEQRVVLGFTNIRASSVDLQFYSPYQDIAKSSFQDLGKAIATKNFSVLPGPSFNAGIVVLGFSRKYKCQAEIIHQNSERNVLVKITPDTRIELPAPLRGETTLYATVFRVGGKEPKVEIETVEGFTLYCDAPREVVTKLGSKLYQIVGLIGIAQWDYKLEKIERFSIQGISEYQNIPLKQAIGELAEATKQYYSDVINVKQYISELRGSE